MGLVWTTLKYFSITVLNFHLHRKLYNLGLPFKTKKNLSICRGIQMGLPRCRGISVLDLLASIPRLIGKSLNLPLYRGILANLSKKNMSTYWKCRFWAKISTEPNWCTKANKILIPYDFLQELNNFWLFDFSGVNTIVYDRDMKIIESPQKSPSLLTYMRHFLKLALSFFVLLKHRKPTSSLPSLWFGDDETVS